MQPSGSHRQPILCSQVLVISLHKPSSCTNRDEETTAFDFDWHFLTFSPLCSSNFFLSQNLQAGEAASSTTVELAEKVVEQVVHEVHLWLWKTCTMKKKCKFLWLSH